MVDARGGLFFRLFFSACFCLPESTRGRRKNPRPRGRPALRETLHERFMKRSLERLSMSFSA